MCELGDPVPRIPLPCPTHSDAFGSGHYSSIKVHEVLDQTAGRALGAAF